MRTSLLLVAALLGAGGAGFALARATASPPRAAGKPVHVEAARASEPAPRARDGEVLVALAALRAEVQALREELHGQQPDAGASARAPAERPEEAEPTPEQSAAHDSARQLVDGAVRAGRWTSADASGLRRLMPSLSSSQSEDILHTLLPAINSGAVKVEVRGRLF